MAVAIKKRSGPDRAELTRLLDDATTWNDNQPPIGAATQQFMTTGRQLLVAIERVVERLENANERISRRRRTTTPHGLMARHPSCLHSTEGSRPSPSSKRRLPSMSDRWV